MAKDRVTLRDVAREAGVHVSTASRALNEETRSVVHPATTEKVLRIASQLGYSPNPLAKGLRTNKSMTVGMVISDIENPLFGPIIAGVEATMGREGYSTLIAEAMAHDHAALSPVIDALIARRVDGMVLAMATRTGQNAIRLKRLGIPVILVNRTVDDADVSSIVGDDEHGIGLAVDHLVALGHTRIGHLAGPMETSTAAGRLKGFHQHMENLGLAHEDTVVESAEWYQIEPGYKAATDLLERRPDLTALVAANDLIALGAYRAIRDRGMVVGTEVSVTGYNDMMLLDMIDPPLTSIRVPYREMGAEAAEALLEMMTAADGEEPPTIKRRLLPTLSARNSTQPPPDS
ncbi:MAG TPA: LacI family DNA-binding transcriptional regulator [Acidimicrobiia bacterium]|nr:LacI family DNA-binding transcriptional regulator [Acidimicrobiia bacterium]